MPERSLNHAPASPEAKGPAEPLVLLQASAATARKAPSEAQPMKKEDLDVFLEGKDPRTTEWRALEGSQVMVQRFNIAMTSRWIYEAWEPRDPLGMHHATITHGPSGQPLGQIGSRRIPEEIQALPVGDERSAAVGAWYQKQYLEARMAIVQAFPEATLGHLDLGSMAVNYDRKALEACPVVEVDGTRCPVPDTGMSFIITKPRANGLTESHSFRVTGWLKREDLKRPVAKEEGQGAHAVMNTLIAEVLQKDFDVLHKEPGTDYLLRSCAREEATHVSGYGVCGVLPRVDEITFTGEYIPWPKEQLDDLRDMAIRHIGRKVDAKFSDIPWRNATLKEAQRMIPGLEKALEGVEDLFHVYVDGYSARGHKKPSSYEVKAGRGGPEHIWVEIAKRESPPEWWLKENSQSLDHGEKEEGPHD